MPNHSPVIEINQQNKEILQSLASTQQGFAKLLDVMADHTATRRRDNNLSTLSCAALAVSGYGDTREALTAEAWARIDAAAHPREGAAGIPVVKASSTGKHFRADAIYPAEAIEGLPEDYYHGFASRIDLNDDVDRAAFLKASGELTLTDRETGETRAVDLAETDPNVQYLVYRHFGMEVPDSIEVVPPSPEVFNDIKALKSYCDSIKSQAGRLMGQIQEIYTAEIRAYEGVVEAPEVTRSQAANVRAESAVSQAPAQTAPAPSRPYTPVGNPPSVNAQAASRAAAGSVQPKSDLGGSRAID